MQSGLISYLAGYFDGEGCISLFNNSGTWTLSVQISSADYDALSAFATTLGGKLHPLKPSNCATRHQYRQQYRWGIRNAKAQSALWRMFPYLRAKVYPAVFALALNFNRVRGRKRLSKGEITVREAAKDRIRAFNNRVTLHAGNLERSLAPAA